MARDALIAFVERNPGDRWMRSLLMRLQEEDRMAAISAEDVARNQAWLREFDRQRRKKVKQHEDQTKQTEKEIVNADKPVRSVSCLSRESILARFRVEEGMITTPCGYCGCAIYVPAVWETFLKNSGQKTKDYPVGRTIDIRVNEQCRAEFPELGDREHVTLRVCAREWAGYGKKRMVEL